MEESITIRQVAAAINIDQKSFLLIEELEAILSTQHDIYKFMTRAIGLDCNEPRDRREVANLLLHMRKEKMREYRLSLMEFVEWFENDPMSALSHLLVEKIGTIHMRRIQQYKVSPEEMYKRHVKNSNMCLFGLLHLM